MAGFIPGLLPTNHSQEKEFAQAYEDVLERYKGMLGKGEKYCIVYTILIFFRRLHTNIKVKFEVS